MVASERAIRHAAWGARKEIRARIRAMREEGKIDGGERRREGQRGREEGKVEGEGGRECVY